MEPGRKQLSPLVRWLASDKRKRVAWSLTPEVVSMGASRSGHATNDVAVAVQAGRALATVADTEEWGGLDYLAGDALVAEESRAAQELRLKDSAEDDTPGIAPWREATSLGPDRPPNIRQARPLEALVARAAKIGPGLENEQVYFPNRGVLIAHHRNVRGHVPPQNSTRVRDPGDGDGYQFGQAAGDDWEAGIHGIGRVRPWVDGFCANLGKTIAGGSDGPYALLLNFTRSGGDNSGFGAAHFANVEALLSHEGGGPLRPADDGRHQKGWTRLARIDQGALDIRSLFGGGTMDGADVIFSPVEFHNVQWIRGGGIFPSRVQLREDFTATHTNHCGLPAEGEKRWMGWDFVSHYPPPSVPPRQPPPDDPPGDPPGKPPTMILPPESAGGPTTGPSGPEEEQPPQTPADCDQPQRIPVIYNPDLDRDLPQLPGVGNEYGEYPTLGADGGTPRGGASAEADQAARNYEADTQYGEDAATTPMQIDVPSVQYHARPALPEGRLMRRALGDPADGPRGELDSLWGQTLGFTEEQREREPVVADDVAAPEYLFNEAQPGSDPGDRWPTRRSHDARFTHDAQGLITGRLPARGPGSVALLPSNAPVDAQFIELRDRWDGPYNAFTRIIAAGRNAQGVEIAGRYGLGLRTLQSGRIASGLEVSLAYDGPGGINAPDIHLWSKDQTGQNSTTGRIHLNGQTVLNRLLPPGGELGDTLTKLSGTDYATGWKPGDVWHEEIVNASDLVSVGGTEIDVALASLPPGTQFQESIVEVIDVFVGAEDMQLVVGTPADPARYAGPADMLDQILLYAPLVTPDVNFTGAIALTAKFNAGGDMAGLESGSVRIRWKTRKIPE